MRVLIRYLISNLIAYVGSLFHIDLCTVNALRFTNILFSIGLYFVLVSLISTLSNRASSWQSNLYALSLAWFPVGFFFNFVYYTDPGSTFFVLSCYLLVKKNHYFFAGIVGLISLTFRQTNVIWVCLFMMIVIIDTLSSLPKKKEDTNTLYNPRCSTITLPSNVQQEEFCTTILIHNSFFFFSLSSNNEKHYKSFDKYTPTFNDCVT